MIRYLKTSMFIDGDGKPITFSSSTLALIYGEKDGYYIGEPLIPGCPNISQTHLRFPKHATQELTHEEKRQAQQLENSYS